MCWQVRVAYPLTSKQVEVNSHLGGHGVVGEGADFVGREDVEGVVPATYACR